MRYMTIREFWTGVRILNGRGETIASRERELLKEFI
jgi:hypothetical protein